MLRVERVCKKLGEFNLRNVSFSVSKGEYLVLLGASGQGKTVLLELIAGLIIPDTGNIFLDEKNITYEKIQKRRLGLVHQDQALFPHMTVAKNIAYGMRSEGYAKETIIGRTKELAEQMEIAHLLTRKPPTLSGGEAQRTALARTLAVKPECLLLDEPLSSLDRGARNGIREILRQLHRKGHTIIHVTHNYEEAVSLATKVAIMEKGTVVQTGTLETVFNQPGSEFVAEFIGIRNIFRGELSEKKDEDTAYFTTQEGVAVLVLTEQAAGTGSIMIRSRDITVSARKPDSSARNVFQGIIQDIQQAKPGYEVRIDAGITLYALITSGSLESLGLQTGKTVWVSFKASAVQFLSR